MQFAAPLGSHSRPHSHRFAKLNPFKSADDEGGDELGQEADPDDIAGGGQHLGGAADVEARKKLRVSHALRSFLAKVGEIEAGQVGADDAETVVSVAREESDQGHL